MEKQIECIRCSKEMKYLKEYRIDSQDNNRGFFDTLLDKEEHLIFDVYVCPKCRHTEFFFKGSDEWYDM